MKGFWRRARIRLRNERMSRRHGLKGRSACRAVVGTEPCCCGKTDCGEILRQRLCWAEVGLVAFLLWGTCPEHRGKKTEVKA